MALDIQPGDVIRVSETVRVTAPPNVDEVWCCDVGSGRHGRVYLGGTTTVEMVKRAPRPRKPQRQDFKAGDIITGEQLRQVQWRRGTIIRPIGGDGVPSRLNSSGIWTYFDHGCDFMSAMSFDDVASFVEFELVYLPK